MTDTFKASDLEIVRASQLKEIPEKEKLVFGHSFSDYMLEVDWEEGIGWGKPKISPYHNLELDPAVSSLHYGIQCFEGMKAYLNEKEDILLFRPEENMKRMNRSCARLLLPQFDIHEALKLLEKLLVLEKRWIPRGNGYSLYIRPTVISTQPFLGVAPPKKAKFFVILCPVGPYFPGGFTSVTLFADHEHVRAWPGGAGANKVGGNYAPTIQIQMDAVKHGCQQVMWLLPNGDDYSITEAGTMNLFCYWINAEGEKELITQPLEQGTILPGITRDSVISLAKDMGIKVVQKDYGILEVIKALKEKRLLEMFGCGTACLISPVNGIVFKGEKYSWPCDPNEPTKQIGPTAEKLCNKLFDLQYGRVKNDWVWTVKE